MGLNILILGVVLFDVWNIFEPILTIKTPNAGAGALKLALKFFCWFLVKINSQAYFFHICRNSQEFGAPLYLYPSYIGFNAKNRSGGC